MPALALADVLKDFGGQQRPPAKPVSPAVAQPPAEIFETPRETEAALIDKAVQEARHELSVRLETEHAEAIAALEEKHKQEVARLHADLGQRTGDTLNTRLEELQAQLVELTSSVAARILGISLTQDIQASALEALSSAITKAVRDREAVRIRIHGPLSLYEALQPQLGKYSDQVEFTETAGFDITVAIDDALFETRLSEWSASLSEIMT